MAKSEVTSKRAASAASKVLRDRSTSKTSKLAAGSALSQAIAPPRVTSSKAAIAASKVLRNQNTSKTSKTAAGLALTQKLNRQK